MSVNDSMAVNLKKFREERGLTQEKLSEIAGCSKNHLSALERGVKFPSASLIDKLSQTLKIKPYELLLDTSDNEEIRKQKDFVEYVMDSVDKKKLLNLNAGNID
ncbi:MAG TPA: hypothetical protein DCO79_13255 [Spirochaeta sp.]|nr:hypothetical protein [Spirochaeta sp.]